MQKIKKNSFTFDDLISCAEGKLFGHGNPQLPMPPMLMTDRITLINDHGGDFQKGLISFLGTLNVVIFVFVANQNHLQ